MKIADISTKHNKSEFQLIINSQQIIKQRTMSLTSSLLFSFLSFLTYLHFSLTASIPLTWVTDPRFVSGTFSYNPITSGLLSDSVVITYTNPTSGVVATRLVALGIVNFQFIFSTTAFNFTAIFRGMTNWGFQADIMSNVGSDINTLKLAYLTVDPLFTNPFSISYFTTANSPPEQGPFSLTYYINFTASTGVILNLTNSNAMLAFQHIIDVTSPTKCFQIDIVFRIFNQSFYEVVVSTTCNLQMSKFGFSRIIFDKTQIEALGECFFQFGELQASNSNDNPLTLSTNPFFSANFMMGMKSFNVNGFSKLKFSTALATTTLVTSNQFVYLSFMYWSFKKRLCPAVYPYFQISTVWCYDICPDGTYSNNTLYICLSCSYTCLTCSSFSVCTSCDPLKNRYLNGTTCPPNPGFFDNSTPNAISCSTALSQCLDCTDQYTCINCSTGYYIDVNNTCQPCNSAIVNCSQCSSATGTSICTQCDSGFVLSADGLTCAGAPSCTDTNCIACFANLSICQHCSSGYIISADFICIGVCGDGIVVSIQQCDDGNLNGGDGCTPNCTIQNNTCPSATPFIHPVTGICVASCPAQFYNNLNTSCLPCFYTCDSCTTSPDCTSCSAANHRTLNGTLCQPEPNYYDNGTVDALPCVSPCVTCSSASTCLTCQTGYYLSSNSCILCSISLGHLPKKNEPKNKSLQNHDINSQQNKCIKNTGCNNMLKYNQFSSWFNKQSEVIFNTQQCQIIQSYKILFDVIVYSCYTVLFLSLFINRIIGISLFGVLQLAHLSLAQYGYVNMYLRVFVGLKYCHGFNLMPIYVSGIQEFSIQIPYIQRPNPFRTPLQIQRIGYSENLFENHNFMLILKYLVIFASMIAKVLSIKTTKINFEKIADKIAGQVFITLFFFDCYHSAFSLGLFLRYAYIDKNQLLNYYISGIPTIFTVACFTYGICILLFVPNYILGQFKSQFKNNWLTRSYIILAILYRTALGLSISIFNQHHYISLLILPISMLFLMYHVVNLPFKSVYLNYLTSICHITQLIILLSANYYNSMKSNTPLQTKAHLNWMAKTVIFAILLCLILSAAGISAKIIVKIKQFFRGSKVQVRLGEAGANNGVAVNIFETEVQFNENQQ